MPFAGFYAAAPFAWRVSHLASDFAMAWFKGWSQKDQRRSRTVLLSGVAGLAFIGVTMKRVPPGHVGLIEDWRGQLLPGMYDDSGTHWVLPIVQHPVSVRVYPVKKKLVKEFTTKDGKPVEVMLQMKMAPKIYYVPEIYLRFGRDYGRSFLEQEGAIDVNSVVSQHTFDELVGDNADTEDIVDEIVSRIEDAAFFHKIKLRDPNIVFRDPNADDDEGP